MSRGTSLYGNVVSTFFKVSGNCPGFEHHFGKKKREQTGLTILAVLILHDFQGVSVGVHMLA